MLIGVAVFPVRARDARSPTRFLHPQSGGLTMASVLPFANGLFFMVCPYLAMFIFFIGTIMRYRKAPFTYSSFSSQFLENRRHFWGLVPFHYGIVIVLLGHIIAFLIPAQILAWNSRPLRLYVLEASALTFGLLALVGLSGAILRRL